MIAKESAIENTIINTDMSPPVVVDKGKAIEMGELCVDFTVGTSTTHLGEI